MASESRNPQSSSVPLELSNLSFAGIHHRRTSAEDDEDFANTTQPLPPSSEASPNHSNIDTSPKPAIPHQVSPTPSYAYVELPGDVIMPMYSTGI